MWYVIQTITGKEEELISLIGTILNKELYDDCFVIKAEWLKRLGGQWQLQVRTMFPGYVFIDTECPERVFEELKKVPRFSKILGNGEYEFIAVDEEEASLLKHLFSRKEDSERIIGLSEITLDTQGEINSIKGAIEYFNHEILRVDFHKRFAVMQIELLGKKRSLIFGIKLEKDNVQM